MATIVWLRRDLRLHDHLGFLAAQKTGKAVIPVFIFDPRDSWGSASKWWLHHSLEALKARLENKGSRLIVRKGSTEKELEKLIREVKASSLFWTRLYEPSEIEKSEKIQKLGARLKIEIRSFNNSLLIEPEEIKNKQGKVFQVFTAFWKTCEAHINAAPPEKEANALPSPKRWPISIDLKDLKLLPKIPWDRNFYDHWTPGETFARTQLKKFASTNLIEYSSSRNIMAITGTSRLSPHLHFGEIGPRLIWQEIGKIKTASPHQKESLQRFKEEIGWREFAHYLLLHFPHTLSRPLQKRFISFPWVRSAKMLRIWQRGQTGYPIVDAGMRELWATGWMHNRVRMITASFLTKDLLIRWQEGAAWFWDTLVDADMANNTLGWQWTAGCGADAAPYFRIFNPVTQGEKFDPEGRYVRRWIPEISKLPDKWIHRPFEASKEVLGQAGIELGRTYPKPIVNHDKARLNALKAYKTTP